MRNRVAFAVAIGGSSGFLFLAVFVACLLIWPDPQNAIGLFLAPFFAAAMGVSVGIIVLGGKTLNAQPQKTWEGPLLVFTGALGFVLTMVIFVGVVFS